MTAHAYPHLLADAPAIASPLRRALGALDLRLAEAVRRAGARGTPTLDELRGLYVSEEWAARLLAPVPDECEAEPREGAPSDHLLELPAWRALAAELAPSAVERDLVLLALARDLRLEYEPVFGFLNDDLTRRWPTRELALRLLARNDAERAIVRDATGESAPLARAGVLRALDVGEHGAWLAAGLAVTPLAAALLGERSDPGTRLPPGVVVVNVDHIAESSAGGAWRRLERIARDADDSAALPLLLLEGRDGSGRTRLAATLAASLAVPLLRVDVRLHRDGDGVPRASAAADSALAAALLWQRLAGAVILLDGVESWCARDDAPAAPPPAALARLAAATGPVLVRVDGDVRWRSALGGVRLARVAVAGATVDERAARWSAALARVAPRAPLSDVDALSLADRFDLTPGRIERIVRRAADEGDFDRISDAADPSREASRVLSRATRAESCDALAGLATRAPAPHGWDDLVLPAPTMARLRDFAGAVRDRAVVLDRWGFARRATRARGVSALFAGASGTGKTMAASVVARELGLDLFVVDLSTVVSKYIGETEKALGRVFRAAREAGAILFFDEADALFGKRSEVKDAHDRYANIEVAYLLQQLDAHDGIVVLATNLSRNLDAAFSRRMRYVLEFPLPGEADRLRLWRGIFPAEAPLDADVDLAFLAASFPLAGGDIRNVALESAYLAAAEGGARGTIAMRHLVRAMARQMTKQGRTPSAAEFRHFVALIDGDG